MNDIQIKSQGDFMELEDCKIVMKRLMTKILKHSQKNTGKFWTHNSQKDTWNND